MQQTAASIAIANKSAPITSPTISSENGEIAAARRAITSLIVRYFWEKCEWARTWQTLARAHQRPKNPRRRQEQLVLRLKELRLHRLLHKQHHLHPQLKERLFPVRRLHPRVRLQQRPRHRRQLRLRQMHHRPRDNGLALLLRHPDKWRTLLREEAVLPRRARRLQARHGRSRQLVCRRCILPRGITCIFMRRVASILIQTCRRTVFSTKNDASPESVPQNRCNFRVPMRHRMVGRLFPRTMQNVLWHT